MNTTINKLTIIALFLITCIGNIYGQKSNIPWNGEWNGSNPEGDMNINLVLNIDKQKNLNPYNANSLCNGFVTIYIIEPNKSQSILSTYELHLENNRENILTFRYNGGREGVDTADGTCEATIHNGKLQFKVIQNTGDEILFDTVAFSSPTAQIEKTTDISTYIQSILLILVYLGIIAHMVYVFFKGDRYKKQFTTTEMMSLRTEQGKPSSMSEDEYNQCVSLLESAFNTWSLDGQTEDGDEIRKPKKMKQIKSSAALIDQAISLQPTEQDIIDRINELTEVINSNEKRYFDGSKALVWLGVIVGILFGFIMGPGIAALTLISTGCYILASRTPAFLIDKRSKRGGGNIHNGMIAGIFGMIAGAQTIRTITTYSDGHKEYSDDHSQHWIAWILGLCLLVIIAFFMALWAIINYLRNYVFYF